MNFGLVRRPYVPRTERQKAESDHTHRDSQPRSKRQLGGVGGQVEDTSDGTASVRLGKARRAAAAAEARRWRARTETSTFVLADEVEVPPWG